MKDNLLDIRSLTLQIVGKSLCKNLDLAISHNQHWGLLGKNGVGKTSLLHCLMGLREIDAGSILLHGKPMSELSRRELATEIGILFQENIHTLPSTVLETVLLGRHPHVQSMLRDDPRDLQKAQQALQEFDLADMAGRYIDSLSGGEKQRLALAMLVVQSPKLFLLDEPSNHLDIAYQISMLDLLKKKIDEQEASFIMATHDINLAARYCDRIILLMGDGNYLSGSKQTILNEKNLSTAYNCEIQSVAIQDRTLFFPA
ncbi:MAG TPA: ABC transporter ATP-binding protein [Gammaproteobacteria bacterium]|jgi:iron complex transport system ATP-binding protein|nr:ABC transporter ATP-binding protein [Gammaproteobacteria bacterium]|tara:strand:+ start:6558 stop:7331 length:774 start_codon:yes stop_codon:yes gene_type:complete